MIILALKSGWPDKVVSFDHVGPVPDGHMAVESIAELDNWKEAHPELRPHAEVAPDPVPEVIPMWAFRRALRKRKMLEGILSFIGSLPEQQKLDAMEHLEYGNYIERYHPMIVGSAAALGLPDSVVDDIFRDGGKEK